MKLRERLWHRQKGRCFYCDRMTRLRKPNGRDPLMFTVDHINREYSVSLVVGACFQCNGERGHLPAHEYILVHAERLGQHLPPLM